MGLSAVHRSPPLRQHHTVCVTGAGGYIASWLVKELLARGYTVHGTLRKPDEPKNDHLKSLPGADEHLILFKSESLDYTSLRTAMQGCSGVFHTAFPMNNEPEESVLAVKNVKDVINAAADCGAQKIVFTSSIGAVHMDPNRKPNTVVDESCWSDPEYCIKTDNWYCYAKIMAEKEGAAVARERNVDFAVVIAPITLGPTLQSTDIGISLRRLVWYMTGEMKHYRNDVQAYADVRDVAKAHLLVYESPDAGRYLCVADVIHRADYVGMLKEMFPEYPVTTRCKDELSPRVKPYKFSNRRLKDLGLEFIPIRRSLYESVLSLREKGFLSSPERVSPTTNTRSSL